MSLSRPSLPGSADRVERGLLDVAARDNARGPGRAEEYLGWVAVHVHAGQIAWRPFAGWRLRIHTIFEGTSEIQQLVIARAISGLRIE